jgi:Tim17/Tim22/Tim23/Pmp24 family
MGERLPSDGDGEGPFYNNPFLTPVVEAFQPLPVPTGGCAERVTKAATMGLVFGGWYNLVAVPWQPDPVDHFPKGVVRFRDNWKFFRSGFARPMAAFASVGMAYAGVECLMESVRDPEGTSKHWNAAAGGFAAGMVMGAMTKRIDVSLVAGLGSSMLMGGVQFSGLHYVSNPYAMAMKVGGKWPTQWKESPELAALKEKYPEWKDL